MMLQTRASVDVMMRVDDSTGRPIEIDRDVLRRSYMALLAMGRILYSYHRPPERFPEEALSMSFHEPSPGAVVFEAEVVADSRLRSMEQPVPLGPGDGQPARSAEHALRLSVHGLVEIARVFRFVLAAPQTVREVHGDHVDLTENGSGRPLRVCPEIDHGLRHGSFDAHMREFLAALGREGVGAVSLCACAPEQRSQIQHMVIATDRVLEFIGGADVPRPLDRPGAGPVSDLGSTAESESGAA